MEFGEKLQNLRKSKGLTQEELADNLYVSRTAISKWESGRGYPSIDSIKEIAAFFSVTIDALLSSEKILSLAEKENRKNIQKICNLLFGIVDLFTFMLILLPLYPVSVDGHIYSVSLFAFAGASLFSIAYWIVFLMLMTAGILKIALTHADIHKGEKVILRLSMGLSVAAVLLLILTRQVYATVILFALLVIKSILYLNHARSY